MAPVLSSSRASVLELSRRAEISPGEDIAEVHKVARKYRMNAKQRREFGRYLEDQKRAGEGGSRPNGDFEKDELDNKAREFLGRGPGVKR
jgi:hypothetical protein